MGSDRSLYVFFKIHDSFYFLKEYFTRLTRFELKFRFPLEFESSLESKSEKLSSLGLFELKEDSENDVFLVSRDFTNDDSENTLPAPLEIDAVIKLLSRLLLFDVESILLKACGGSRCGVVSVY